MLFLFLPTNKKGKIMSKFIKTITIILSITAATSLNANSLDTLERERAKALGLILDKSISIGDRKKQLENSKLKLLDLERITINSKDINKQKIEYALTDLMSDPSKRKNLQRKSWDNFNLSAKKSSEKLDFYREMISSRYFVDD